MRFLGHSTVRVEIAGRVILTDPVLTRWVGPLRRVVSPFEPADRADVDTVPHIALARISDRGARHPGLRATPTLSRR